MMENTADQPMPENPKCPQCGTPLPAGALAGLCPACLLKQGTAKDSATQPEMPPFVPPGIEEIARLFPQLEILKMLGKGGMGAVYQARQPALDRMVALKVLPARDGSDTSFAERFTREARALARLSHPNIVGVHEFGQAGNLHYFIMEFVDGVNLRELQKSGRLSPHEALQIVPQLCDALQYAHDQGVVHRDIKPENVLVDRRGRVKIADFGLAKILGHDAEASRLTAEGHVMGTPHYMSPEQVEHPLEVDHRADIYSLGVVFYEMLTGELPLGKFQPPSRKVSIDVRLDDVVLRALEKEPDRRYQQAGEVKTRVENIAQTPGAKAAPIAAPVGDEALNGYDAAFSQVQAPAIGLIIAGLLDLLAVPIFGFAVIFVHDRVSIIPFLMLLVLGGTIFLAGRRMKRLESHTLSLIAGVLAMLTPPGFIIGLPAGIWALVVLMRGSVSKFFGSARPAPGPQMTPQSGSGTAWKVALLVGVAMIILLFMVVVGGIAMFVGVRQERRATEQAQYDEMQAREKQAMEERRAARDKAVAAWSPTMPSEGKLDPMTVLTEARELRDRGDYQPALTHYLWYWKHALEYNPGLSAVRLSFALSDWIELGRRYPEARQALVDIRDEETKDFSESKGYFALFQEVASINQYLRDDDATYQLFQTIRGNDQELAEQCFPIVEPLLVKRQEYSLCMEYIPDPKAAFDRIRDEWERMKQMEDHMEQIQESSQKQIEQNNEKIRQQHPEWNLPPAIRRPAPPKMADENFVKQTRQLIEILVATDHKDAARRIQADAVLQVDDPRLRTAAFDVEKKLGLPATLESIELQTVDSQPPVVVETDPPSGATDVAPGTRDISVRFSKDMRDKSWSWSIAWSNSIPDSVATPRYDDARRTCTMPVKLEPGHTYAFWLNSEKFHGFQDSEGRAAPPYLLIFQTRGTTNTP